MTQIKRFLACLMAFTVTGALNAEENLLSNGTFSSFRGQSVTSWTFPKSMLAGHGETASLIEYGVYEQVGGNKVLRMAVKEPVKTHVWWQQEVPVLPATEYKLTVRYRGVRYEGSSHGGYVGEDVGFYFLNEDKRWISYARAKVDAVFDGDWHTLEFSATTPDNAAFLGVRLGMLGNQALEICFDDAVLQYAQ